MRLLGIDYGDARMGLAVCDEGEILASVHENVNVKGINDAVTKAVSAAEKLSVKGIVVGMPLRSDGIAAQRAEKTRVFIEKLKEKTDLEIFEYDERYSTVCASTLLNEANVKKGHKKSLLEAVSAVVILQGFIDRRKNKNI